MHIIYMHAQQYKRAALKKIIMIIGITMTLKKSTHNEALTESTSHERSLFVN
jgi:hypothetical protein